MQLQYDQDFVEAAVGVCAWGRVPSVPRLQIARFHREREALYSIADTVERDTGFFELHLEWFREWGLEAVLTASLREFSMLGRHLSILAIRTARGRKDEGAELYVNEAGQRTGILSLRPERLTSGHQVAGFLGHELSHLQDMVNPAFGYSRELNLTQWSPGQQRLAQERYCVLWDTSIDGRRHGANRPTIGTREGRWQEFTMAFGRWPEVKRESTFTAVWNHPRPTHLWFLDLVAEGCELAGSEQPTPGGLCPLCRFPTFVWADPLKLTDGLLAAVRREFPIWLPEHGLCGRCCAVYRSRLMQEVTPV
jgi:hypothetical protein